MASRRREARLYRAYVRVDEEGRYRGHGFQPGPVPAGTLELPLREASRRLGKPMLYLFRHDGKRVTDCTERQRVRMKVSAVGTSGASGVSGRTTEVGAPLVVDLRGLSSEARIAAIGAGLDEIRICRPPRALERFTPTEPGRLAIRLLDPELLDLEFGDRGVEVTAIPAPSES